MSFALTLLVRVVGTYTKLDIVIFSMVKLVELNVMASPLYSWVV